MIELIDAVELLDAHFNTVLKPALKRSDVNTSCIRSLDNAYTGVTMIIVDFSAGRENCILFSDRVNYQGMQLTPEVLATALTAPVPDVIVMQREILIEMMIRIMHNIEELKKMNRANRKTSIDAESDVIYNSASVPPDELPQNVWDEVDHLIMNETEAELMMSSLKQLTQTVSGADWLAKKNKMTQYFHKLSMIYVLITLRSKEAWYSATEEGSLSDPVDRVDWFSNKISATKISEVINITAAENTFVRVYATQVAWWRKKCWAEDKAEQDLMTAKEKADRYEQMINSAMWFCTCAAARCMKRLRAMSSILWRDKIWLRRFENGVQYQ